MCSAGAARSASISSATLSSRHLFCRCTRGFQGRWGACRSARPDTDGDLSDAFPFAPTPGGVALDGAAVLQPTFELHPRACAQPRRQEAAQRQEPRRNTTAPSHLHPTPGENECDSKACSPMNSPGGPAAPRWAGEEPAAAVCSVPHLRLSFSCALRCAVLRDL